MWRMTGYKQKGRQHMIFEWGGCQVWFRVTLVTNSPKNSWGKKLSCLLPLWICRASDMETFRAQKHPSFCSFWWHSSCNRTSALTWPSFVDIDPLGSHDNLMREELLGPLHRWGKRRVKRAELAVLLSDESRMQSWGVHPQNVFSVFAWSAVRTHLILLRERGGQHCQLKHLVYSRRVCSD